VTGDKVVMLITARKRRTPARSPTERFDVLRNPEPASRIPVDPEPHFSEGEPGACELAVVFEISLARLPIEVSGRRCSLDVAGIHS
jgi:hypothetical protein